MATKSTIMLAKCVLLALWNPYEKSAWHYGASLGPPDPAGGAVPPHAHGVVVAFIPTPHTTQPHVPHTLIQLVASKIS